MVVKLSLIVGIMAAVIDVETMKRRHGEINEAFLRLRFCRKGGSKI